MHEQNRPKQHKVRVMLLRIAAVLLPLACAVVLLSQTVFAKNTFVITDGDRVLIHTSFSTDPADILYEAGLTLGEDDTYTTADGSGVSEITVQRMQTIRMDRFGESLELSTSCTTVEALLDQLGITLDSNTLLSHALTAELYDGMELTLSRMDRTVDTYTVVMPYEVVVCYDENIPEGTQIVVTEGVEGEKRCTANVVYTNGLESQRAVIHESIIQEPVNQVVLVGTGEPRDENSNAPIITGNLIITADGEVLTYTRTMQFVATAYTKTDEGCDDWTATGTWARVGAIAVDPRVIPYGTRMFIVTNDGEYIYGIATAEDCGGAINGNRLDLYFDTTAECFQFGVRSCTVYFLG